MTHQEMNELAKKYDTAFIKYHNLLQEFFIVTWNGVVEHEATKSYGNPDNFAELESARNKYKELEEEFHTAIQNREKLER